MIKVEAMWNGPIQVTLSGADTCFAEDLLGCIEESISTRAENKQFCAVKQLLTARDELLEAMDHSKKLREAELGLLAGIKQIESTK